MLDVQTREETAIDKSWVTPIPLLQAINGSHPYPLDALPPIIRNAVNA